MQKPRGFRLVKYSRGLIGCLNRTFCAWEGTPVCKKFTISDFDTPRPTPAYKKAPAVFTTDAIILLCITSGIECAASCSVPYKQSLFHKLLDCILNGSLAECRTKLHALTFGELSNFMVDSPTHRFDCRQLFINHCHTILEVTVRSKNGLQQILDIPTSTSNQARISI